MSGSFKTASEYITALRRLTSTKTFLKPNFQKSSLNEIIGSSIPFIPSLSPPELRSFTKSLLLIQTAHKLNLNSLVFKTVNKRLLELVDSEDHHSVISTLNSLSQIHREKHDGGPPPLRPDTVWKFLRPNLMHASVLDKCELLTIMSRLNLRPFDDMMVKVRGDLGNDLTGEKNKNASRLNSFTLNNKEISQTIVPNVAPTTGATTKNPIARLK